jgi:hypothetical protein
VSSDKLKAPREIFLCVCVLVVFSDAWASIIRLFFLKG